MQVTWLVIAEAMVGQIVVIPKDSGAPSMDVAAAIQQTHTAILEEKAIVCRQNEALQKENKDLRAKNTQLLLQIKQMEIDGLKQQLVAFQGNEANRPKTQVSRGSNAQATLEARKARTATADNLFLKAKYAHVQDLSVQRLSAVLCHMDCNLSSESLSSCSKHTLLLQVEFVTGLRRQTALSGASRHWPHFLALAKFLKMQRGKRSECLRESTNLEDTIGSMRVYELVWPSCLRHRFTKESAELTMTVDGCRILWNHSEENAVIEGKDGQHVSKCIHLLPNQIVNRDLVMPEPPQEVKEALFSQSQQRKRHRTVSTTPSPSTLTPPSSAASSVLQSDLSGLSSSSTPQRSATPCDSDRKQSETITPVKLEGLFDDCAEVPPPPPE